MTKVLTNPKQVSAGLLLTLTLGCAKTSFVPDLTNQASSAPPVTKTVTASTVVAASNKQVDFLLVLDDSSSMMTDLQKLASRLSTFVTVLEASQIDWQMCVTTTRASNFGTYLSWQKYSPEPGIPNYVLTKGQGNLNGIFKATIDAITIGGADSFDERAAAATYASFKGGGPCYRSGAAVSVIAISDEDERSVGGDVSKLKGRDAPGSLIALEASDLPVNVIAQARSSFGPEVRFTFNSIIVKPGDSACETLQDLDVSPSHPGYTYAALSSMTAGGVGSICDLDYSASLNTFRNKIVNSLGQLTLQCEPVEGTLQVWVNHHKILNFKSDKRLLRFASELSEGTQVDLSYDCVE